MQTSVRSVEVFHTNFNCKVDVWNMRAVVIIVAAWFVLAQVSVFAPSVDYLWLGARWAQLPKFPGDVGVLALSFYTSAELVDVAVSIDPKCQHLVALDSATMASAGPGVVTASVRVVAKELNRTCPANVVINARYKRTTSGLEDGITKVEYAEVFIPPYPAYNLSTRGAVLLGFPSNITLVVENPYAFTSSLSLQGQGARVASPIGSVKIGGSRAEIPVVVVAEATTASLLVTIQTKDWLGEPVSLTYSVPLFATPPPPPILAISPAVLSQNKFNSVNITVILPVVADGVATISVAGAAAPRSAISVPIKAGKGSAVVDVYPIGGAVTFTAQVAYSVGGVSKVDQVSATAAVQQEAEGASAVEVKPNRLVAGVANNVTLLVRAPGPFNVSVTVSNAAVDKPAPFRFGGVGEAAARLVVTPLAAQPVVFTITVRHSGGVDQYTVTLPATSASIFTVTPMPSLVKAGGNRTVVVKLVNSGDVAIERAVVTITPATGDVAAPSYTFQIGRLAPLESAELPISFLVPVTQGGAVAFTYNIVYVTELGASGTAQGAFYVQVYQVPAVNISSVVVTPPRAEVGKPFYITVTVLNEGFVPAINLQLRASAPEGVKPVANPYYFAGRLDPQASTAIPLSFNATAPGRYDIELTLTYIDRFGNPYTVPYTVTVEVANTTAPLTLAPATGSTAPTQSGGWIIATILAVAVLAVMFYFALRKR
ncbi:conserved repeat domain protein [Pyrobaculum arsenaticum DSM 13514]|uniref:Conserved repeat domain protein n=2 Tax=Pyrobaculum arsenaticum TaxID=121277 RepID=A4WJT6_PYRAR|nr:conserved repeat domain protein [Pyrobaculum arsenaticum DSM 13514]